MLNVASEVRYRPPKLLLQYWFHKTTNLILGDKPTAQAIFVSRARIQKLYNDYVKINKATTVLTFPWREGQRIPGDELAYLGEVYICHQEVESVFGTGARFRSGLRRVIVHATLHLLNFDHGTKIEGDKMQKIEKQILGKNF